MNNKKITVNLVDDHKVVTEGLRLILTNDNNIEILDIADSGELLLTQLQSRQPNIIIIDYSLSNAFNLNKLNGLETSMIVKALYPNIKILILSMHESEEIIVHCVEGGIHGYMLKSELDFDIRKAVNKLYKEGNYYSPEIANDLAANIEHYHRTHIELTDREKTVLDELITGKTAKEISVLLNIKPRTVETHKQNMIVKFKVKSTIQLIRKALKGGYLTLPLHDTD